MNYAVTEIFVSIQGEGRYVGLPCNFIRLAGCSVNCKFCDTDKQPHLGEMDEWDITSRLDSRHSCVVLTGGEPTEQALWHLCSALHKRQYTIHLETSGLNIFTKCMVDFVTVSPKKETYKRLKNWPDLSADEVKWLVPTFKPEDILWNLAAQHWLQPINDNRTLNQENLVLCVQHLKRTVPPRGKSLRLSIQLHKVIGVR